MYTDLLKDLVPFIRKTEALYKTGLRVYCAS